jgi:predicted RNA-binding Zn ribbon-like protein
VAVASATPTDVSTEDGRPPAPEPLELVRQFVNSDSWDADDADELTDPDAVRTWFASRGLLAPSARVTKRDVQRVVEVREALRAMLLANNGEPLDERAVAVLNDVAQQSPLEARFGEAGTITVTGRDGGLDGALGQLLAVVVQAVSDGTWPRLKACRAHDCQWAFYDRSRNRSGQWCVMAVCGNRSKARSYRDRKRGEGGD